MSDTHFSYDPDDGFVLHDTEEEAKKRAQTALELSQKHPDRLRGDYEFFWICWGDVREIVKGPYAFAEPEDYSLQLPDPDHKHDHDWWTTIGDQLLSDERLRKTVDDSTKAE